MSHSEHPEQPSPYVPAARSSQLTFLYDGVFKWTTRETAFKRLMIGLSSVGSGDRLLDVGSGMGALAIAFQSLFPRAQIVGLDGDEKTLDRVRSKARRGSGTPQWEVGMSSGLPFGDDTFSWAVTSLLFHNLSRSGTESSLAEAYRVLKPNGTLMLADWGDSRGWVSRSAFLMLQVRDGHKNTVDTVQGLSPSLIGDAGFSGVEQRRRFATPLGMLSVYLATKPSTEGHAPTGAYG